MSYFSNPLTDYSPQLEMGGPVLSDAPAWFGRGAETALSEDEELDLAARFLELGSERDVDDYVEALLARARHATNEKLEETVERDLGDIFKGIAKAILPVAGGALGMFVGGPAGAALGGGLASSLGHAFGLELEGLSSEDGAFEIARRFVRFADAAINNARGAGAAGDPAWRAREAVVRAAQAHAPGLIDVRGGRCLDRPTERTDRSAESKFSQRPRGDEAMTMESNEHGHFGSYRSSRGGYGLSEEQQMGLAAELMEVTNEQEFENFLGDLISKGAQAIGKFVSSPTGQALGGALKDAAKTLLPVAGAAVGDYFGGSTGGQIGGALGTAASNLFEAEAEAEEREWEAANVFVRVAVDAVNNAADAPRHANPHDVAHHAVAEAVRRHAPFVPWPHGHEGAHAHEGRSRLREGSWVRHGRTIVLHGV
jgi:hypothetical protein